jgi:hypothetical protein
MGRYLTEGPRVYHEAPTGRPTLSRVLLPGVAKARPTWRRVVETDVAHCRVAPLANREFAPDLSHVGCPQLSAAGTAPEGVR